MDVEFFKPVSLQKNKEAAQDCHADWLAKLTPQQKQQGWEVSLITVESWDDVPVNALKIN